jgi:hypothetical protein
MLSQHGFEDGTNLTGGVLMRTHALAKQKTQTSKA